MYEYVDEDECGDTTSWSLRFTVLCDEKVRGAYKF